MKVFILGGGVAGLTSAYYLTKENIDVLVIDKDRDVGGFLKSEVVGGTPVEQYYHHVFKGDDDFFEIVEELGLNNSIEEIKSTTGFYYEDKLYNLTTPIDLLFYKPLSFWDKFLLGKLVLKIKSIKKTEEYSDISIKEWIIKNSNQRVYERFFKPLLESKYGKDFENVSLSWFLERIKLRSDRGLGSEKLFYMKEGFQKFIEKLKNEIKKNGGEIKTNTELKKIDVKNKQIKKVSYGSDWYETDWIINTAPPNIFNKTANEKIIPEPEYQGAVCVFLVLKKSLCNYYWTNIINKEIPFGAYIEHTNIQPKSIYGNNVVSYLASYPNKNSKIWNKKGKEVFEIYFSGLKKIFDVDKNDVVSWKVFRDKTAGIVYRKDFPKELMMNCKTPIKNLLICGMFNSYPERSINNSVVLGKKCSNIILKKNI